jgi:hypothetical protein
MRRELMRSRAEHRTGPPDLQHARALFRQPLLELNDRRVARGPVLNARQLVLDHEFQVAAKLDVGAAPAMWVANGGPRRMRPACATMCAACSWNGVECTRGAPFAAVKNSTVQSDFSMKRCPTRIGLTRPPAFADRLGNAANLSFWFL